MGFEIQNDYCAVLDAAAQKLGQAPRGKEQAALATLVRRVHNRLAQPPRIALLGEVNSGKSSLANLLIGESVVPTSVVANSRFPVRFYHAVKPSLAAVLEGAGRQSVAWSQIHGLTGLPVERVEIGLPVERLRTFEVVDTPGTGSPRLKARRVERQWSLAHLPIWCTVAARAWKESERREWLRLAGARKADGILVVTQIDLLPDRADIAKVLDRLRVETAGLFGKIVPLAVPDAVTSSVVVDNVPRIEQLWLDSGGAQLERAIWDSLSDIARQRVASAKRALRHAFQRRGLLSDKDEPARELGLHQAASDGTPFNRDNEHKDDRVFRGLSELRRREEIGL